MMCGGVVSGSTLVAFFFPAFSVVVLVIIMIFTLHFNPII